MLQKKTGLKYGSYKFPVIPFHEILVGWYIVLFQADSLMLLVIIDAVSCFF